MKIKYRICDACLEEINVKDENLRMRKGVAAYIRHGWKFRRIDICERCLRNLDRLPNEQSKKVKEQK